jgi:hypothetical protein
MTLELAERLVRIAGGLLAFVTLGVLFYGVWRLKVESWKVKG